MTRSDTQIAALIEKMDSVDNDVKFMALTDMISEMDGLTHMSPQNETNLCQKIIKFTNFDFVNWEIQTLAIKCWSYLCTKVNLNRLKLVNDHLITLIKSPKSQPRSVASLSFKSMMPPISNIAKKDVVESFLLILNNLIDNISSDSLADDIKIESFDVIIEILLNFPYKLKEYHDKLLQVFLKLTMANSLLIRKKSYVACGIISLTVDLPNYYALLCHFVKRICLLTNLSLEVEQNNFNFNLPQPSMHHKSPEETKHIILCLSSICRRKCDLSKFSLNLVDLLFHLIENSDRIIGDTDAIDSDELKELAFQTLENILKVSESIPKDVLHTKVIPTSLKYTRYGISEDNEEMELENSCDAQDDDSDQENDEIDSDYENENYDDFDSSWKVRRASLKVISTFFKSNPRDQDYNFRLLFDKIVTCLNDSDENVFVESMNCVSDFLKVIVHPNMLNSKNNTTLSSCEDLDLLNNLNTRIHQNSTVISELCALISDENSLHYNFLKNKDRLLSYLNKNSLSSFSAKKNAKRTFQLDSIQLMIKLYKKIITYLPGALDQDLDVMIIVISSGIENKSINNSLKSDLLSMLNLILLFNTPETLEVHVDKICNILVNSLQDSYHRIVLDSLGIAQVLISYFYSSSNRESISNMNRLILDFLTKNDCDNEIRENALITGAISFHLMHEEMPEQDLLLIIATIKERMGNETAKLSAIKAANIIAMSNVHKEPLRCFLPFVLNECCGLFVKTQKPFLHASIVVSNTILKSYPDYFSMASDEGKTLLKLVDGVNQNISFMLHDSHVYIASASIQLLKTLLDLETEMKDDAFSSRLASLLQSNVFIESFVKLLISSQIQGQIHEVIKQFCHTLAKKKTNSVIIQLSQNLLSLTNYQDASICIFSPIGVTCCNGPVQVTNKDVLKNLSDYLSCLIGVDNFGLDSIKSIVSLAIQEAESENAPYTRKYLDLLLIGHLGGELSENEEREIFTFISQYIPKEQTQFCNYSTDLGINLDEIRYAASIALSELIKKRQSKGLVEQILLSIQDANKAGSNVLVYFFVNSINELLNTCLYNDASLAKVTWDNLFQNSYHKEEGTRNLIAECLAKLIPKNPDFINALFEQMNTSDVNTKCTIISTVKILLIASPTGADGAALKGDSFTPMDISMHQESNPISNETKRDLLLKILKLLLHPSLSLNVRLQVMIFINTISHQKPSLIRMITKQPLDDKAKVFLSDVLIAETLIKKELIRLVEMGPFKHEEDGGLEIRKTAFECILTMVENKIEDFAYDKCLDSALDGLKDCPDIKILSLQVIAAIPSVQESFVSSKIETVWDSLRQLLTSRSATDEVKQEIEKSKEVKRFLHNTIEKLIEFGEFKKSSGYQNILYECQSDKNNMK